MAELAQTATYPKVALTPGKCVCVGRNYVAHAQELNNPVPSQPLLFIKPGSSCVPLAEQLSVDARFGEVHYETELALLIGHTLARGNNAPLAAVTGMGLAFDLTRRTLQEQLKQQGQPWEIAKAFDGSAAVSDFVAIPEGLDWQRLEYTLTLNQQPRQHGNTALMIFPIATLLSAITEHFTLQPGDIVLTGTPAGVAALHEGDQYQLTLFSQQDATPMLSVSGRVVMHR